ncbi:MAG: hypothetical protein V4450_07230 [Bacteroidota bacterium]
MENTKRAVTAEDLEKFPALAEKGVTEGAEHEFDTEGNPVFEAAGE